MTRFWLVNRLVDGRLSDEVLFRTTDDEIEAALSEVSAVGSVSVRVLDLCARSGRRRLLAVEREMIEMAQRCRTFRGLVIS
jgi:hypothetical protein